MSHTVVITEHATERFCKRHRPDLDFATARHLLWQAMLSASRLREKTYRGDVIWHAKDLDVYLVGKDDRAWRATVVVTTLPKNPSLRTVDQIDITDVLDEYDVSRATNEPTMLDVIEAREAGVTIGAWMAKKLGAVATAPQWCISQGVGGTANQAAVHQGVI